MALVEVRNVSKSFASAGKVREVLSGVHLTVEEGEFVSIVGSTGSGKSTLMAILAGLQAPDSGTVTVGGEAVRGIHPHGSVDRWSNRAGISVEHGAGPGGRHV